MKILPGLPRVIALAVVAMLTTLVLVADPRPDRSGREGRRAFDGAPPVVPHEAFGDCTDCHYEEGTEVPDIGFAPASPHRNLSMRCEQCHVLRTTDELFVASRFEPVRSGDRREAGTGLGEPPVIPHDTVLRGNCAGCHAGDWSREWLRTTHPERVRCQQCHVAQRATDAFSRGEP